MSTTDDAKSLHPIDEGTAGGIKGYWGRKEVEKLLRGNGIDSHKPNLECVGLEYEMVSPETDAPSPGTAPNAMWRSARRPIGQ